MVPVGTAAKGSWCPAISRCWSCRRTARSSIRSSGFGTICAVTGSPTRCFPAWRTSWRPARWPGTGSPTTTAWSARSARSPRLRLRPPCRAACYRTVVCDRKYTQVRKYPEIRINAQSQHIVDRVILDVRNRGKSLVDARLFDHADDGHTEPVVGPEYLDAAAALLRANLRAVIAEGCRRHVLHACGDRRLRLDPFRAERPHRRDYDQSDRQARGLELLRLQSR